MSLLERLRHETRPHHRCLEDTVGLAPSLTRHQAQIRDFFGFVEPWEKRLQASPHASFLAGREKTPLLIADLRHAGLAADELVALPRCEETPATDSLPAVLGALYVFEGSTLGGQMISRHLEDTLGLRDGRGYAYFRGYGAETAGQWQAFRQTLIRHSSAETDDLTVSAAQNTFSLLHRWFSAVSATA